MSNHKNTIDEDTVRLLIEESHKIKQQAYVPYSNFRVGAAILSEDGTIFTGCNVENSCYAMGLCAEKCAIGNAVSRGHQRFKAIAVASDLADIPIVPCGGCRQVLAEFGGDWLVYLTRSDRTFELYTVSQLLPSAFSLNNDNNNSVANPTRNTAKRLIN